jgi:hypothetical protein
MGRKKGKQKARHWLTEREREREDNLNGTCNVFAGKYLFLTESFIIESIKLGLYSLYSNNVDNFNFVAAIMLLLTVIFYG